MAISIDFQPGTSGALDVDLPCDRDDDVAAIRAVFAELIGAQWRGDGHAYGSVFPDEADYVAFDDSHTKGRRVIAESHQKLFATWLKGNRLLWQIESLCFLSPVVAVIHATGATLMPGKERPVRPSIQTLVAVKHDGAWRFGDFHNARIVHRSALQ